MPSICSMMSLLDVFSDFSVSSLVFVNDVKFILGLFFLFETFNILITETVVTIFRVHNLFVADDEMVDLVSESESKIFNLGGLILLEDEAVGVIVQVGMEFSVEDHLADVRSDVVHTEVESLGQLIEINRFIAVLEGVKIALEGLFLDGISEVLLNLFAITWESVPDVDIHEELIASLPVTLMEFLGSNKDIISSSLRRSIEVLIVLIHLDERSIRELFVGSVFLSSLQWDFNEHGSNKMDRFDDFDAEVHVVGEHSSSLFLFVGGHLGDTLSQQLS